jgi:hypothetical protein
MDRVRNLARSFRRKWNDAVGSPGTRLASIALGYDASFVILSYSDDLLKSSPPVFRSHHLF